MTGCKTTIELPVKLSDFEKKDSSIKINGAMAMEVTSCTQQNSDMPSDDIFKLQKQIPYVFKGAKYIECKKQRFKSYALFKIPANIDNVKNGKPVDDQVINLSFFPASENGGRDLNVSIPLKLGASINNLIKSNLHVQASDISMSLMIDPEGKKLAFTVVGAYLDGIPVQMGKYNNNGGSLKITIPAYGLEQMLKTENRVFIALINVNFKK